MSNQSNGRKTQNSLALRRNAQELLAMISRQGSSSFTDIVDRATGRDLQQTQLTIQAQILQQDKQYNELRGWHAFNNPEPSENYVEQQPTIINAAADRGNQVTPNKLFSTEAVDPALSYSEQRSINERNTLFPMTHQSPPCSSNGCHPESFVVLLEQDKVFLHHLTQDMQQHSSVSATRSIIVALGCNPWLDQGIPATLENPPLVQEASQDDCQQEHYSQSSTRMETNNYQAEHDNTIYHDVPPHPPPTVTPSEASDSSSTIDDTISDDFSPVVHRGSEGASSSSSFTTHSENLSTSGDDEGLVDHRRTNNGSAEGKSPCSRCPRCHKGFSRERDFKRHKQEVHEKVRRSLCRVCGESFSRVGSLNRHMNRIHNKNK